MMEPPSKEDGNKWMLGESFSIEATIVAEGSKHGWERGTRRCKNVEQDTRYKGYPLV
jgi:hypothetical protein